MKIIVQIVRLLRLVWSHSIALIAAVLQAEAVATKLDTWPERIA